MGYLQVLQSLVRAYKIAKGTMPRGLDLLKMKMKARRKALDSKKIIQFPPGGKDKTNPFGIMEKVVNKKGKYVGRREPEAQMKIRMERQNREAAQRIRDKKKPRDDKANGGSPNLPFPGFLEGVRPGGMPLPSLDYYDDDAGVKGLMKKRKKKKKKREKKATGGMANISQTYDNNPTLQAQFPNKQDYLDLFGGVASTTVAQTPTPIMTEQATQPVIKPIKPILPIIPEGDGGGGITSIDRTGLKTADDYGLGVANQTGMGYQLTEEDLEDIDKSRFTSGLKNLMYDVKQLGKFSPYNVIKSGLQKSQDFALDLIEKAKQAAAARELAKLQAAARAAGFQGDTRTQSEQDFASSQTYGGGGTRGDMGADTFT